MQNNVYIYIGIMALVTYLVRVLPMTIFRKEIKNKTIRSFLYYVPYVTLTVMTFPAILEATGSVWSGIAALVIGVLIAWKGGSLLIVSVASCVTVFVIEMFILT